MATLSDLAKDLLNIEYMKELREIRRQQFLPKKRVVKAKAKTPTKRKKQTFEAEVQNMSMDQLIEIGRKLANG